MAVDTVLSSSDDQAVTETSAAVVLDDIDISSAVVGVGNTGPTSLTIAASWTAAGSCLLIVSATAAEAIDNGACGLFSRMARMFALVSSSDRGRARAPGVSDSKSSSGCVASSLGDDEDDEDRGDDSRSARSDGDALRLLFPFTCGEVDFPSPSDVDGGVGGSKSTSSDGWVTAETGREVVVPQPPFYSWVWSQPKR